MSNEVAAVASSEQPAVIESLKVELEVGKETKEVIDALVVILQVAKEKNPAKILEKMDVLMKAVDGFKEVGAEAKLYLPGEAGYLVSQILGELKAKA